MTSNNGTATWPDNSSFVTSSSQSLSMSNAFMSTPNELQNHLYSSFLQGHTADVALHVRGSWEAVYKLHRVVLIQAGFFRPMFTGDFSESRFRYRSPKSYGPEQMDIIFDDPNITRAAFELCISRLYGGGPPLHVSQSLIPTPLYPLTRSFPAPPPHDPPPHGHHPASPRFLLSLLATAVYLSIPSIAGLALKSILNTVGPTTVLRYLNFGIGKGIGPPEDGAPDSAVGLEKVAQIIKPTDTASFSDISSITSRLQSQAVAEDSDENETKKEDPAESVSTAESEHEPWYFYGGVSNKVGEAAACWLARWAGDILTLEQGSTPSSPRLLPMLASISSKTSAKPVIWARGGLNASWVRAILSSDLLFVKGERERYDMAKTIFEFRRRDGKDEAEELEFEQLFTLGIHYIHMCMEDLMAISRDVSPSTGQPYVTLSHLRACLWDQSILRHHITVNSPRDKELGLTVPTAEAVKSVIPGDGAKRQYLLPSDSSERIGDSTGIEGATMDQLFTGVPQDPKRATPAPTSERNFFGLLPERHTTATVTQFDKTGKHKWTPYPPFRFSVEFWDVECMKEKTRMHSHTVWYAGSLYNAYVQVIRKKGVQLGVYLHRQSHIDPLPPFSVPHHRLGEPASKTHQHHQRVNSHPTPTNPYSVSAFGGSHSSATVYRSTTPLTPHVSPGSPTTSVVPANNSTSPVPHPPQPYRDPRASISSYFSISCCSATGSSITRFTSGPDVFAISQSWGWKSSSLRTEEYLELDQDGLPVAEEARIAGKEVSLRATVVIGVV